MADLKTTIEALKQAGMRGQFRRMAGGAPVAKHWEREIGAGGHSEPAAGAVALARRLGRQRGVTST